MRLTLAARSYDLTTRALVVGTGGSSTDPAGEGADLVERTGPGTPSTVPVYAAAADDAAVERALRAGADLLRLQSPTAETLERCRVAGAAVVVPLAAVDLASATGLPPGRIVPESLLLDVADVGCPLATTVVGVLGGARLVRTADVRGARRICDVLAAVLEVER